MPSTTTRYELLCPRVERFTRMLQEVEEGDVRAVHRTRVASRRLREVLPVLQLKPAIAEKLGRRLRKITERLGPVRELDVLLALIDELHQTDRYSEAALDRVAAVVRAERDSVRRRVASKRSINELKRLASKLEKLTRELESEKVDPRKQALRQRARLWALDARAARRAAALQSSMRAAGAVYQPDRLHAIRISVKKLRYATEVSADVNGVRSTADLRLLRRMQETLGRLHDLHVLVDRVRQLQASLQVPDLAAWRQLDTLVLALEDECRRLHARYMANREALEHLADRLIATQRTKPERVELKNGSRSVGGSAT